MACRRITVEIEATGRFQNPVQFQYPHRHHGEIGHQVVLFQERAHGPQHLGRVGVAADHHLIKSLLGAAVPSPGILERLNLGL